MSSPDFLHKHWDIFCKVVDNFGDIGVCWRLAHQLAEEHDIRIRLWVDDLPLAERFAGKGHPNIVLQHWTAQANFAQAAPVVIETFGCGLPETYQQGMRQQQSFWVNVDYLSAEPWVDGFHAQPSPQANGLVRYFFYPGFTPATGGLIREASLPAIQGPCCWADLGLQPAPDKLTVSLFSYSHAPLAALVHSLQHSIQPVRLLVTEPMMSALAPVLRQPGLKMRHAVQQQACELIVVPFLSQADYDRLLYLCDVNFVRGEDSWIRALWAGKPLVWLPYQQSEAAHLVKLNAFMTHYLAEAEMSLRIPVNDAALAWAQGDWQDRHWESLLRVLPQLTQHAQGFRQRQLQQVDLATNLVIFIEKSRIHRV